MTDRDIEREVVFGATVDKEYLGLVTIGVPAAAWEHMKGGETHKVDLTKVGLPVRLVMFGGKDHATVKGAIDDRAAAQGAVLEDLRRDDFRIDYGTGDDAIQPCPFCASMDLQISSIPKGDVSIVHVHCPTCQGAGPAGEDEDSAVAGWNARGIATSQPIEG